VRLILMRLLVMVPASLVLACGKKETSLEDVKSDLIKSISLASEAETFVRYISQGHSTYDFASGHLNSLLKEVNRSTQEISELSASPYLANAVNADRVQLSLLAAQIENVSRNLQDPNVLDQSEQQIDKIRTTLVQANSSL